MGNGKSLGEIDVETREQAVAELMKPLHERSGPSRGALGLEEVEKLIGQAFDRGRERERAAMRASIDRVLTGKNLGSQS